MSQHLDDFKSEIERLLNQSNEGLKSNLEEFLSRPDEYPKADLAKFLKGEDKSEEEKTLLDKIMEENKSSYFPPTKGNLEKKIFNEASLPLPKTTTIEDEVLEKISEAIDAGGTELDLSWMGLKIVPSSVWQQLPNLSRLFLDHNELTFLPINIRHLSSLSELSVSNNKLSIVPKEIGELAKLKKLNLSNNELINITKAVGSLSQLVYLRLDGNHIKELPSEICKLYDLEILLLQGNKLNIPAEILGEISVEIKNAQKILSFLRDSQLKPVQPLNETKMLVVGQGGVGKTSLVARLADNTFDLESKKTNGIDIRSLNVNTASGQKVKLNIWDFGGQEVMHSTHQFFLTQRSIYLFVLDARIERDANKPDYWFNLIEQYGGSQAPIIVAINKTDSNPILSLNEAALMRKYNIVRILRTSCLSGVGIEGLKRLINQTIDILPHVSDAIPSTWFSIKQALELERTKRDIIKYEFFANLCNSHELDKPSRPILLRLLHDLGTVLNFYKDEANPVLEETNILNPEWVTDGVYAIINSKIIFDKNGVLYRKQLGTILPKDRYRDFASREFILGMMEQFELAFPFNGGNRYLIPDLLPHTEPRLSNFEMALNFEYRYKEFIPQSVFSRFIVRQHEKIEDRAKELWRNGVVIHFEGQQALVRADGPSKRITIEVQGDQNRRRELLAIVRSTFDAIHGSFAKLRVSVMVPIPDVDDAAVSYKALLKHEAEGKDEIYVEDLDDFVPVAPLLLGVDGERSVRELNDLLSKKVSPVELKLALENIGVDYDKVEASYKGKTEFVLELGRFLRKQGKVDGFLQEIKRLRPDIRGI